MPRLAAASLLLAAALALAHGAGALDAWEDGGLAGNFSGVSERDWGDHSLCAAACPNRISTRL